MNGYKPIVEREVKRILRIWKQTLLPPLFTTMLYTIVFGFSLQRSITDINGFPYIQFTLPGLIVMSVIMTAFSQSCTTIFIQKFHGNIQEVLVAPIKPFTFVLAHITSSMFRGGLITIILTLFGVLVIDLPITHAIVMLVSILLSITLFSILGIYTALWARTFDHLSVFQNFLITPLSFLGGVFYSVSTLPQPYFTLSQFNPIFYIVDSFRYGFLGVKEANPMFSILVLFILCTIGIMHVTYLVRIGYKTKH